MIPKMSFCYRPGKGKTCKVSKIGNDFNKQHLRYCILITKLEIKAVYKFLLRNMKDKSRLSLGRKRQVSEQSGQASINNTSNKQRRVVNEDDALSKTEHPKIEHDEV